MIQTQNNASNVYTDINALQGIRTLGKENKDAALMEVAKQFESLFLNMMLTSMRQANAVFKEDSLIDSQEMDFYEKMYRSEETRLNSSHVRISYAVFCLKKKKTTNK